MVASPVATPQSTQSRRKLPARNFMPACNKASWMAETRAERRSRVSSAGILLSCSSRSRASSSLGSRSGAFCTVARRSLMRRGGGGGGGGRGGAGGGGGGGGGEGRGGRRGGRGGGGGVLWR